ncbi:L,D-transpeptidase family protein [Ciceribacter sp. L1K22]|uniref:L,D-transpeptidase family protein n=1 Tax=Ciceribacter sp. L1K22 TaxID=2820275 RepID=UPI001ABEA9DE|nr:L,D-transpeptidase family protein [Ciceribacter sp. L1K22]MBO3759847.1 L,D-transpeptidase family protein [Ciceribacter sp. L1K22]
MSKSFSVSLGVFTALMLSSAAWAGDGETLQIYVSKKTQSLAVYDGDEIVATSNVSTGKAGHTTPSGIFSILEKRKYHESNLYSNAPMPWMQRITWSGVALHESSSVPNYPASHGCVRLPGAFAKALFQMTERGAHVIITDEPVTPQAIAHPTLFKPEIPAADGVLLSDAEMRPATFEAGTEPVEVAVADVQPKLGATATVAIEALPPLRILITRRDHRETVMDVQAMLNALGFDAGDQDGQLGSRTIAAVKAYKESKQLPAAGDILSDEFIDSIYAAAGKGKPPTGQILVRQKFKPLFEAPISIDDPGKPLGTHFLEATHVNRFSGKADWHGVTLDNHLAPATRERLEIDADAAPDSLQGALDRVTIPDDIRQKIAHLLDEGTSITISDVSDTRETGLGTDFITITRATPRA